MEDKVNKIIPLIQEEIGLDDENDSRELYDYYHSLNLSEKKIVNNVIMYLCGWSLETIIDKCRVRNNLVCQNYHQEALPDNEGNCSLCGLEMAEVPF